MVAYIFNKGDRKVFNFVKDVIKVKENEIKSNTETFTISDTDDFAITNNTYEVGNVIPETETNKLIKTQLEILQEQVSENQGAIDFMVMNF